MTRSVPDSESYLLLTRPIYQSPGLEHLVLTVPIVIHVVSGFALRNIRAARRARLYGVESRVEKALLKSWPKMSLQAKFGYILCPLLGIHVLVNRIAPLIVEGGSSGVGLGYIAHGFSRRPVLWNTFYPIFVASGVWHIVGGWATWMGWNVTTVRKERGRDTVLKGDLRYRESEQVTKRRRRIWLTVNGIAAVGTSIWLAGALGIIGFAEPGSSWEANGWNAIYKHVPVIGRWL